MYALTTTEIGWGLGLAFAFGAIICAFAAHLFYRERLERAHTKGRMQGLAMSGWVTRNTKKVSWALYEDCMDVKIGGILPITDTVDEAAGGLVTRFHKEMMKVHRQDPERFLATLQIVAPTLLAIKATANKVTLGNIPAIIKSVAKLVGDVKTLAKFLPKPAPGDVTIDSTKASPPEPAQDLVSAPGFNPVALLMKAANKK